MSGENELSGLELSIAVAKRLMGWTDIAKHERLGYASGIPPMSPHAKSFHVGQPVPHFAKSNDAAMLVLAKFPVWNINKTDHPDFADRPYSVSVCVVESEHSLRLRTFEVQAATMPEGVCRAALAAIGAQP